MACAADVADKVIAFGQAAAQRVVQKADALALAARASIALRELGGSGLGVIGALGSVGLRAGGNEGRFIDLPSPRHNGRIVSPFYAFQHPGRSIQWLVGLETIVRRIKAIKCCRDFQPDPHRPQRLPVGEDPYLTEPWLAGTIGRR